MTEFSCMHSVEATAFHDKSHFSSSAGARTTVHLKIMKTPLPVAPLVTGRVLAMMRRQFRLVGPLLLVFASLGCGLNVFLMTQHPSVSKDSVEPGGAGRLTRRATTVFFDDFSSGHIDAGKWQHAVTGNGGGGHEFNMYTPEAANSYVKNGVLYIRPTLTVDHFGDNFLSHGTLDIKALWGRCTDNTRNGCLRRGSGNIPVTMSAMLTTRTSIRYGRVEVVAQLPKGDWLWPAIWMLPDEDRYGEWPRSGEIDVMESRGNLRYHSPEGWAMGASQDNVNIHYGQAWDHVKNHGGQYTLQGTTFADGYHTFWMDWTADHIKLGVDNHTLLAFNTPSQGYWHEGRFQGDNVWASGGKDAPFDRPFHLILNVAVGGDWFRARNKNSPYAQPWHDDWNDYKMTEFWNARRLWQPTWHGEDVAMKVASVRMMQY